MGEPEFFQRKPELSAEQIASAMLLTFQEIAENSHIHRWDIIGVWKPNRPVHPRIQDGVITVVLVKCSECGLPQTVNLGGDWSEEQVKAGKARNDDDEYFPGR